MKPDHLAILIFNKRKIANMVLNKMRIQIIVFNDMMIWKSPFFVKYNFVFFFCHENKEKYKR